MPEYPLVKFDDQGKAAVLRYDLPGSTSLHGLYFIEIEYDPGIWIAQFRGTAKAIAVGYQHALMSAMKKPPAERDQEVLKVHNQFLNAVAPRLVVDRPALLAPLMASTKASKAVTTYSHTSEGSAESSAQPGQPPTETVMTRIMMAGLVPAWYYTQVGAVRWAAIPPSISRPRIILVERYCLSSYPADYGAGKTVNTFSLLPGEKTVITVKTWKKSAVTAKEASSVFDACTSETQEEFADSMQDESSHKEQNAEASSWHVEASAECSWGFGSAKVSGGAAGSCSSAREDFAKNVHNASSKHADKKSAKREVSVTSSFETHAEAGEEQTFQRTLENANMSRVLNFVFRQLNQEYISVLSLEDVRIAAVVPKVGEASYVVYPSYGPATQQVETMKLDEYPIGELEDFLKKYIMKNDRNALRNRIVKELCSIFDYRGDKQKLIEAVAMDDVPLSATKTVKAGQAIDAEDYLNLSENIRDRFYLRVTRQPLYPMDTTKEYTLEDRILSKTQGIVTSVKKYIMRTDSIIVDALLGQGQALDEYALETRKETIRAKAIENDMNEALIAKMNLAKAIIEAQDDRKASVFEKVYPKEESKTTVTTTTGDKTTITTTTGG